MRVALYTFNGADVDGRQEELVRDDDLNAGRRSIGDAAS